jgi:hypothetical protein
MQAEAKWEPSLEEIAAICETIRESWTEQDHYRRAGYPNGKPPVEVTQTRDRSQK